jgi:hypothetical protein
MLVRIPLFALKGTGTATGMPNNWSMCPRCATKIPGFRLKSTRRLAERRSPIQIFVLFLKLQALASARSFVKSSKLVIHGRPAATDSAAFA